MVTKFQLHCLQMKNLTQTLAKLVALSQRMGKRQMDKYPMPNFVIQEVVKFYTDSSNRLMRLKPDWAENVSRLQKLCINDDYFSFVFYGISKEIGRLTNFNFFARTFAYEWAPFFQKTVF